MKIDFCTGIRVGIVRLFEMNSSTGNSMMNSAAASSATKAKRVAKKTDDAPAPVAPVVATPAPAAPVAEAKKGARKAAAPTAAVTASTPAPAPVAAPVAPAATEAPAAPATTLDEDLKSVLTTLTSLRETVSSMITEVKRLDKRVHREIKDARRRKRRVRAEGEEGAKRGPSIFEIPTKVTDELCRFLGKPAGTLISRSNVTKELNNYVKTHNLKVKHDIKPDAALRKLLQVPETDQLTYFNLQKYLNKHYIKEAKPTTA
jgi:chromatin remodeling complex protein RSC6